MTVRALLALVVVTAPGCSGTDAPRDNGETASWILGSTPLARIGEMDGPDPYLFQRIRTGVLLNDGRVAVVDGTEIRIFGLDGAHHRTIGGQGEGPGEFRLVDWIVEDSSGALVAFDRILGRISRFAPGGDFLASESTQTPVLGGSIIAALEDGQIVVRKSMNRRVVRQDIPEYSSDQTTDLVLAIRAQMVDTLFSVTSRRFMAGEGRTVLMGAEPLGPNGFIAAGSNFVALASAHSPHLVWSMGGLGRDSLDMMLRSVPLEPDVRARFQAHYVGDREGSGRIIGERVLDEMAWPDSLPRVDRIAIDSDDRIWVRHFVWDDGAHTWSVFTRQDGWIGTVQIPSAVEFLDARGDEVLVSALDAFEVPRVEVWPLHR